jgi:rhodanese-related sulfurtransferase
VTKHVIQFATKTVQEISVQISSGDRRIAAAGSLKLLGLTVDTSLIWRHHISELTS